MNYHPETIHVDALDVFEEADELLTKPFEFFGFSISLNKEHQIDCANRSHIRYYKKKV